MEQKFKKIIQHTKAWDQGVEPLSKTFAGDLFKDSSWIFSFDPSVELEKVPSAPMKPIGPLEEPLKAVKTDALSLVLFVGDTYREDQGEDLLGKMILAMKLKPNEFNRVSFDEKLEEVGDLEKNLTDPGVETSFLFEQINKFKPHVVVTLGATVTNILLGRREKLSGIHGQFFERSLNLNPKSFTYQLMPVFHPEFLLINPNMKRTAWIDLQKVMERVGKI